MKIRAAASIALAAALATGLAGCNFLSPQRTQTIYDASDGVSATVGDIELRNALILVDGDEPVADTGRLLVAVVNHSGEAGTINVTTQGVSTVIEVTAEPGLTPIGYGDGAEVVLSGTELAPGGSLEVTFTGGAGASDTVRVPILDGTLAEYSTLVPTTAATPSLLPVPAATGEPTEPSATEEAAE